MFNEAKVINTKDEEFLVRTETLRLFCLNKYRTFFFLPPKLVQKLTKKKIEEWTRKGEIDKRIYQMWKARKK